MLENKATTKLLGEGILGFGNHQVDWSFILLKSKI